MEVDSIRVDVVLIGVDVVLFRIDIVLNSVDVVRRDFVTVVVEIKCVGTGDFFL